MNKIEFDKLRPWLDPVKTIGYIALIPFIMLTICLKGIMYINFVIWCFVSVLMMFGMIFYFIVGPLVFTGWESDAVKKAFRPYRIGGLLIVSTLLLVLTFSLLEKI